MKADTFSVLHATFGRPEKAVAAMLRVFERASNPAGIEYIFACNIDDPALQQLQTILNSIPLMEPSQISIKVGDFAGSAAAWDAAASVSYGEWLVQMQDDVEPQHWWDHWILWNGYLPCDRARPVFFAVGDGYRKDALCCTAIMNRARYEQCSEFLHSGYVSVFSDDEVTIRAYADAADGKCVMIEARDICFLHRHCYHDKTVLEDETYRRENSAVAYEVGGKLFRERNQHLVDRGFKKWS